MKKHYLIQLISSKQVYWLNKAGHTFRWTNHGEDKQYKNLGSAIKMAEALRKGMVRARYGHLPPLDETINVVEVTFKPCNPELPDGFYEAVRTPVYSCNVF